MFKCQAVDRNDRLQRASMLVDILCRQCTDDTFSAFRESLVEVGQQGIVDHFFTGKNAVCFLYTLLLLVTSKGRLTCAWKKPENVMATNSRPENTIYEYNRINISS